MGTLKERTDKLFQKPQENKVLTFVQIMEYFHWSWEDLMKLPIPSYLQIVETVNEIEKKKEAEQKKSQRKR